MPTRELERLTRIEEQIQGIRDDMQEMKLSTKAVMDIIARLHATFMTRSEAEKQEELRERSEVKQQQQIAALWDEVDKLKQWKNKAVGALAVFSVVGGFISIVIHHYWK